MSTCKNQYVYADTNIKINKLAFGKTCSYNFFAKCGAPVFMPLINRYVSRSDFNLTYVEYETDETSGLKKIDDIEKYIAESILSKQ